MEEIMACFAVPLAEAVVVTVSKKILFQKNADAVMSQAKAQKIESFCEKIGTLEKMLYGGSFLLAAEHLYHGEISFLPPFLTAMKNPEEIPLMLHEIATVGVGMAAAVTAVWGVAMGISALVKKLRAGSKILRAEKLSGEFA